MGFNAFSTGVNFTCFWSGGGWGGGAFWGQRLGVGGKEGKRDCMCAFRSSLSLSDSTLQKVLLQASFES